MPRHDSTACVNPETTHSGSRTGPQPSEARPDNRSNDTEAFISTRQAKSGRFTPVAGPPCSGQYAVNVMRIR